MIEFKEGQIWQYKGDIETMPREVEVIDSDGLKLRTIKPGKREIGVKDLAPKDELHRLFIVKNHEKNWKLKKSVSEKDEKDDKSEETKDFKGQVCS